MSRFAARPFSGYCFMPKTGLNSAVFAITSSGLAISAAPAAIPLSQATPSSFAEPASDELSVFDEPIRPRGRRHCWAASQSTLRNHRSILEDTRNQCNRIPWSCSSLSSFRTNLFYPAVAVCYLHNETGMRDSGPVGPNLLFAPVFVPRNASTGFKGGRIQDSPLRYFRPA